MSIIKHPNQRVGVFIDAQNLYHSGRNLYGKRVNFKNIMDVAISGRSLIRALAYVITTEAGDEKNFFEALTKLGVETKAKDLQVFSGGAKKGDWDVGLAIDAVTLAPKLDTVVLVTGDGDFVPLVEYLKKHSGCQVEVISFARSSSSKLIEACDDFYNMDEDYNKFLIHTGKKYGYHKNYTRDSASNDLKNSNDEKVIIERPKLEKVSEVEAPVKKSPVKKKTAPKKVSAKKTASKKSPAKKATIKKAPVKKKTASKKSPAKKTSKKK